MALVKFGGGVVQMTGSIAGNTFARNRYGNYVRARTKPINPNSTRQQQVRDAISAVTARWRNTLNSAQRTAWGSYATAVAMKNKLGESTFLSGFNHYVRSNTEAIRQGLTPYDDGPTTFALPSKDPLFGGAIDDVTQKLSVDFDDTMPWVDEDGSYMFIYMGSPQLVTRNFFGGPWRYAGKIVGKSSGPETSPVLIDLPYTVTNGQKVFFYARIMKADGRITEQFFMVTIVALVYHVTGTLAPDATDDYDVSGFYNNQIRLSSRTPGYYIWWDGVDTWVLSEVLGDKGSLSWERTDPNIVGLYGPEGTATGDATVALGETPE